MMVLALRLLAAWLVGWGFATAAAAVPTPILVRVLAKDAKFVGDPAGGASVIVRDAETGQVLASGKTVGGAGDTNKLMVERWVRGQSHADPGDAAFSTIIDISEPRRISVEIGSPGLGAYGGSKVSQTQWVLPGKPAQGPGGWVLVLPGFIVDILKPSRHSVSTTSPLEVPIEANVAMMCGCPVEAGGTWDSTKYQIEFQVKKAGRPAGGGPLAYTGTASRFAGRYVATGKGVYSVTVTAYDPATGNAGVAETTFEID